MHMIGKDNPGDDFKRMSPAYPTNHVPKEIVVFCEKIACSVGEIHREKIGGSRMKGSAIALRDLPLSEEAVGSDEVWGILGCTSRTSKLH